MGRMGLPRFIAEQLDLTDAQREQIRAIIQEHASELRQLGARVGAAMQAQHGAITAEVFDEQAIRAAAADVATAHADLAVLCLHRSADARAKLSQL